MVALGEIHLARGGPAGLVHALGRGKEEGPKGYSGPAASCSQGGVQGVGVSDGDREDLFQRLTG